MGEVGDGNEEAQRGDGVGERRLRFCLAAGGRAQVEQVGPEADEVAGRAAGAGVDGFGRLAKSRAQGLKGRFALDLELAMGSDVGQAAAGPDGGDLVRDGGIAAREAPLAHVLDVAGAEGVGGGVERGELEGRGHERSLSPCGS